MANDEPKSAGFRWNADAGKLRILLPNCISESKGADDWLTLFRVLRQYHKYDQAERSTQSEQRGDQEPVIRATNRSLLDWLECRLKLLHDHRESGLLRYERRTSTHARQGHVDWHRTIHREFACISDDSSLYLTPFRRVVEAHDDHPLTLLHAQTMRELSKQFGPEARIEVPGHSVRPITPELARRILMTERNQIFRDRDRQVMRLLAKYWLDEDLGRLDGQAKELLWTDSFEAIWEGMTKRVIGKIGRVDVTLPTGTYYVGPDGKCAGLNLRPDFVVDAAGTRIVFDAKYYTSGTLPQTADILKQLAYTYFNSRQWHNSSPERVHSVFLLPCDSSPTIQAVGRHQLDGLGQDQQARPLAHNIWLFRIDYRSLAQAYLSQTHWDAHRFLDMIRERQRGLDSLLTITPHPATLPPSGDHLQDALPIQGPTAAPLHPSTLIANRQPPSTLRLPSPPCRTAASPPALHGSKIRPK